MNKEFDSQRKQSSDGASREISAPKLNQKNKVLWSLLFLVIAVASIWAVTSYSRNFSFRQFVGYIRESSPLWLTVAFLCMLGFIYFEAAALRTLDKGFSYPHSRLDAFYYSASDIYFSAITPSATGGQPACAFFMMRDGIPGIVVTMTLLVNLTMYTLSIVLIGLIGFLLRPQVFFCFNALSKTLILIGFLVQIILIVLFVLLLVNEGLLHRICNGVLHFLAKIRLVRHEEERRAKLEKAMADYGRCANILKKERKMCWKVFLFNFLQRISQISVTLFTFLAAGGYGGKVLDVWAVQGYATIGACSIPIPGAMGVTDYLMLDGFEHFMPEQQAINLELLSRSFAFYFCVIICGIAVLVKYFHQKGRKQSI